MQSLFNYSTLDTRLEKSTRTLFITLNRPSEGNILSMEMLFELESLFAWCTSRIEINSIFINSSATHLSKGIEKKFLIKQSGQQLEKVFIKLQKIIFSMMQLPQTIIIDIGEGSELTGSEFCLGADIRIAEEKSSISFNHLHYGIIPGSGGMNMLSTLFGFSHAKNWIQTGTNIDQETLKSSGFIRSFYTKSNHQKAISSLLQQINSIAPVQRIQSKLALFESLRQPLEAGIIIDRKICKAALISEDWKKIKIQEDDQADFIPAKSMSYAVKLSLIKSPEENITSLDH